MSENVAARQRIEARIVRAIVTDALAQGYVLEVECDGEIIANKREPKAVLIANLLGVDEATLIITDPLVDTGEATLRNGQGWVHFVFGNDGYDVVSDYTTNLEGKGVLERADAIAKRYEEKGY